MTRKVNRATRNDRIINDELAAHGGVCSCGCGTPLKKGRYHWHHDPRTIKLQEIANLRRATVTVLKAELRKCAPMAPKCHLSGRHAH